METVDCVVLANSAYHVNPHDAIIIGVVYFPTAHALNMLGAGFSLAVAAGFFAAMASVFSKLAFEGEGATLNHITCPFMPEAACSNVSKQAPSLCATQKKPL